MTAAAARRAAVGRAAPQAVPAANPHEIRVVLRWSDQLARPVKRPPSSRTIARLKAKAEAEARNAAAAQQLQAQVQRTFRPPPGKVFGVDTAALLLIGPAGALGTTTRMAKTLEPLAAGGRHLQPVLLAAGSWADEAALREALTAIAPKLSVLGLRICRRKAGLRMAKVKPAAGATAAT